MEAFGKHSDKERKNLGGFKSSYHDIQTSTHIKYIGLLTPPIIHKKVDQYLY